MTKQEKKIQSEYNSLKDSITYEQWQDYCDKMDYAYSHNGYDCLA